MIKKTIQYLDADGISRSETFYFNLTKAELLELEVGYAGTFSEAMQVLVESKDVQKILRTIKEIILKAYGERSDVSRHFIKKPEYAEAFSHTEAYSNLFMEFFQSPDKAAEFFNGLMPADLVAQVQAEKTTERPQPQDFRQKAAPVYETVTDVSVAAPVEIIQDHHARMSRASFVALSSEDAQKFIADGGQIDSSL